MTHRTFFVNKVLWRNSHIHLFTEIYGYFPTTKVEWTNSRPCGLESIKYFLSVPFLFFFCFLVTPCSMWDLSSPTRDRTCAPCIGSASLNHWTTGKVPCPFSDKVCASCCSGSNYQLIEIQETE